MKYENVVQGRFLERPNRFIAMVDIAGKVEKCHVKNTGRCQELFLPGAEVYLEKSRNPDRKTAYDLIGAVKNKAMVNVDSQAPNKVVLEWLNSQKKTSDNMSREENADGKGLFSHITCIKPECKYGSSRIDFYVEAQNGRKAAEAPAEQEAAEGRDDSRTAGEGRKIFIEVKGVTLEEEGIARFPDAPTERGIKHIQELQRAVQEGYEAYILFVIQMKEILHFEPNDRTHKAFGDALRTAKEHGVGILAYDCIVGTDSLTLDKPIEVRL